MTILKRHLSLLTLVSLLLVANAAQAAGVTEIRIVHETGRIFVIENGTLKTPEGYALDAGPTLDVLKGDEVRVLIYDPNPLLFNYKLEKLAPVTTADQKELLKLATSFDTLVKSLEGGIPKASAKVQKLRSASPSPQPSRPEQSCNESITALGKFLAVVKKVEMSRKESSEVIEKSLTDPARSKAMVRLWNIPQIQKDLTEVSGDLDKAADALLEAGDPDPCAGLVALARNRVQDVQKTVDDMKNLADLVEQIGIPLSLPPFVVKISEDQPIKISIARSKNFPSSLATNTRFVGDKTITIVPRSRVDISVAPAMVYSFVRDPSFDTEEKNGKIFIRQKENPYKKLDLAAMLELEPHAWDLGPVNLGVQLGVAPQSDLGLFLGLSLRASDLFTFGAGVAFQKVKRLQRGLVPNQEIASKDLLKTEDNFDSGLYIHLTVSLPKKN